MTQQFSLFARMGKDLPASVLQELMFELKVSRVMTPTPITISSQQLMEDVKTLMRDHRFSGIPVVDDGELVGIVSVQDLIHAFEEQALDAPVQRFMTPRDRLITVMAEEPVFEALKRLEQTGVVGQAQVVVRAEIQHAFSIDYHPGTGGRIDGTEVDKQPTFLECSQFFFDPGKFRLSHKPSLWIGPVSITSAL